MEGRATEGLQGAAGDRTPSGHFHKTGPPSLRFGQTQSPPPAPGMPAGREGLLCHPLNVGNVLLFKWGSS